MFEKLLPLCLRAGVDVITYWDLTLAEITAILKNYQDIEEAKAKETLAVTYSNARLIAQFVSCSFNGKPIPSYEETFPNTEIRKISEKERKEMEYKQAMFLKEQMEFAAKAHNAKRAKNGGDGLSH